MSSAFDDNICCNKMKHNNQGRLITIHLNESGDQSDLKITEQVKSFPF